MYDRDRDERSRLLRRRLLAGLGVIGIGLLIGVAVGRPFSSPESLSLGTAGPGSPTAVAGGLAPPATPSPSATPVPTPPPATVAPPATFSPDAAWKIVVQESFDAPSSWPASEQPGWASGYENGRYWLKLDGQRTLSYYIPLDVPEFRVAVDVQVQSGYAGLQFLSGDPEIVYRFLIDTQGRYRLERQQGGEATALRDWTASDVLQPGSEATNRLQVQRVENEVTLFANGTELLTYTLPAGETLRGRAGMTLDAVGPDAPALAYFDNLVISVPLVS